MPYSFVFIEKLNPKKYKGNFNCFVFVLSNLLDYSFSYSLILFQIIISLGVSILVYNT